MHSRSYNLRDSLFQPAHKILAAGLNNLDRNISGVSAEGSRRTTPEPPTSSTSAFAGYSAELSSEREGDWLGGSSASMPSSSRAHSRTPSRSSHSRNTSRDSSPPPEAGGIPLLPVRRKNRDGPLHAKDSDDAPFSFGRESGLKSWFSNGKMGWWMWNTKRGEATMIALVVLLYCGSAVALMLVNRLVLWTGVYKFPFPIAITAYQLIFTQLFLYMIAGTTRSFSRSLYALGLGCLVAPGPIPDKGKARATSGSTRSGRIGIFHFNFMTARRFLPVSVAFSVGLLLTNIAFAYSMLQIYHASRIIVLPLTIGLSYIFLKRTETITTLSAAITVSLALLMVSLRPNMRFSSEGFVAGLFSNLFIALYPILLTKTLAALRVSPAHPEPLNFTYPSDSNHPQRSIWMTASYTNIISAIFFIFLTIVTGELGGIMRNCYFLDVLYFWLLMTAGALLSTLTYLLGIILINLTSPTTFIFCMYPRAAALALPLARFRFPVWSWVGVAMVYGCAVWYVVGKAEEIGGLSGPNREVEWEVSEELVTSEEEDSRV